MNSEDFATAVRKITQELSFLDKGSCWDIDPDKGHSSYIALINKNNENEGLAINHHERENRFDISANWPWRKGSNTHSLAPSRPYNHKGAWFSFGCSAAKEPVVVAKEIMRRLMEEYRAKLAEILMIERKREEAETCRERLTEGIATILGIPYKPDRHSNHGYPEVKLPYEYCPGIDGLEIEVASDTDFRLKFECSSVLLLMNVLATIKKHIVDNRQPPQIDIAATFAELRARNLPQEALFEFVIDHWDGSLGDLSILSKEQAIETFSAHCQKGGEHAEVPCN